MTILLSIVSLIALLALRFPIAIALGLVAFCGISYTLNANVALRMLGDVPFGFLTSWELTAVPLFLLMGAFANYSGISMRMLRAARIWLSFLPGGLAVAANIASAGFAAACGSSVAASAAMSKIAVPEMLKLGYDKGLATGTIAAAGTLSALIPPSILMVLFGIFAQVSVVKLLVAGILPGILTAIVYSIMIIIRCWLTPSLAPPVEAMPKVELRKERRESLLEVWPIVVVMIGILGGLYGGIFTPTEAGACGAVIVMVIGILNRGLTKERIGRSFVETVQSCSQIFFVGVGAVFFTKFLAAAGVGPMIEGIVGEMAIDPLMLIFVSALIYLVLGMFLDPIGIMLITVPVFLPMFRALDMDLIWIGVIIVKYVEIGMITPPVGFNVFVIKNALGNRVELGQIFRGCWWFLACEVLIMALLISFPQISLFLPSLM